MLKPGTYTTIKTILHPTVIVAALGYFVDIYDLILFGIVRNASLTDLGYSGVELRNMGVLLLDLQMGGMLVGGLLWGILGDKKGRLSVLFGSIIMYSLANLANGFVYDIYTYGTLRFIAGVGLAGELGAGVTLVTESLPQKLRGYGTMLIAAVGTSGAILANFITTAVDNWRISYFIGGGLGLMLLILRIGVMESGMFNKMKNSGIARGNFLSVFTDKDKRSRYIKCILIGIPVWYVVGVLIMLSPEFGKVLGVKETVVAGEAIMYCYLGLVIGDFLSGTSSQLLKSRKKVVLAFLLADCLVIAYYLLSRNLGISEFYFICFLLGITSGYWIVFATIAAEQFGTNLRATVATSVPNFVRGSVVPVTILFQFLAIYFGIITSAAIVGAICMVIAIWALTHLKETYHKDLNYIEA